MPPLRERREDISALISHFVSHYARKNERQFLESLEAIQILETYSWPGNIRELAAEIERLVLYADDDGYIRPENISTRFVRRRRRMKFTRESDLTICSRAMSARDHRNAEAPRLQRRASEALGLGSRQTLYKKLKRLAIDIGDFLQEDTEPGMQYRA